MEITTSLMHDFDFYTSQFQICCVKLDNWISYKPARYSILRLHEPVHILASQLLNCLSPFHSTYEWIPAENLAVCHTVVVSCVTYTGTDNL